MDRESGLSPWLVAGVVALVLAIGALAYFAGRFRAAPNERRIAQMELPAPGPPAPDVQQSIPTPGDVPPTVTPSTAVLIEKSSTSTGRYVERSSQVIVPVASQPAPTARPSPKWIDVPPAPRPSPTPTVPELGEAPRAERPEQVPTPQAPEPPPPVPTAEPPGEPPPEPEPEPTEEPAPTPRMQASTWNL